MDKLTVVWQRNKDLTWETDWVHYLFSDITIEIIDNLDHTLYIDNSVLIDTLHAAPYHNEYAKEMKRRSLRFGLVHLTDEGSDNDISSYPICDFVVRNFYRQGMPSHVLTVPLGWTVGNRNLVGDKSATQRPLHWSCIVHRLDMSRVEASQVFGNDQNGLFYAVDHHGPRLSTEKMSEIYRDSIFVLCPSGRITPESFRVFEALESGAIPVVTKTDYWQLCYGIDFPAIQVNHWREARATINIMLSDSNLLEKYRRRCVEWWAESKITTKREVEELVQRTIFNKGQ
ncbi:MAG: hypothetical protein EBU90_19145 [Proteobacteria bacterium]|nr:hypothetical protein [Pseudomonadota bacterium]